MKELLGYEGVQDGLRQEAGPKNQSRTISFVWEVITSKDILRYRRSHKLTGKGDERNTLSVTLHKIQGLLWRSPYTAGPETINDIDY